MLSVAVPGQDALHIEHLVLDFNGTLACDGALIAGVSERLGSLGKHLSLHVVTADTFGTAAQAIGGLPCKLVTLPGGSQAEAKLAYVQALGPGRTACIGNGYNDRLMLAGCALGIAVIEGEGTAQAALAAARIVCPGILAALDLLSHPKRIVATLRA